MTMNSENDKILLKSGTGKQLYRMLPEIYRTLDNGDLAKYLDALGSVGDRIKATLYQRLADSFPDNDYNARDSQPWLIPYFADLFDVRLLSAYAEGRREEVANAVVWRKIKGTLSCIEEIAESVGQMEVEIQEGYKRLVVTPFIGMNNTFQASTFDFSESKNLDLNPGSYDDQTKRTVDFRTPGQRQGHYHPKRIILFMPLHVGFFHDLIKTIEWTAISSVEPGTGPEAEPVIIEDSISVYYDEGVKVIENITDDMILVTHTSRINLVDGNYKIIGIGFNKGMRLDDGRLELERVAVRNLTVSTIDILEPVLIARDCLFRQVRTALGFSRLEFCTVLKLCVSEVLQATDSIFTGPIKKDFNHPDPPEAGCIRYSSVPEEFTTNTFNSNFHFDKKTNTTLAPVFYHSKYGRSGCGVLYPETEKAILFGAEDCGEMGAYHFKRFSKKHETVIDKLKDYLPVGMEAVLITDPHLRSEDKGDES